MSSPPLERSLLANGLNHHVLVWNESAPTTVVCCHGFLDQAWSYDGFAQRLVAEGFRVVAFDWRGHGQTDHVGAGGYYHFADYVLDLHELMPVLASGEMHLVGHSMGGTVSALYTATHPGVVKTLTLIEGLGPPAHTSHPADKMRAWIDSVDRHRRRPPRGLEDLSDAVMRMRSQNTEISMELAYFLCEKATVDTDAGLAWRFDGLHRTTSPSLFSAENFSLFLARIGAPTLVVTGSRGFTTSDHAKRVAALPNGRESIVEDVGHMIHQLAPDALADLVLAHVGSAR